MDGHDQKELIFETVYDECDNKFWELQEKINDPIIQEQLENIRQICETFTTLKLIEIERHLGIDSEPLCLGRLRLVKPETTDF